MMTLLLPRRSRKELKVSWEAVVVQQTLNSVATILEGQRPVEGPAWYFYYSPVYQAALAALFTQFDTIGVWKQIFVILPAFPSMLSCFHSKGTLLLHWLQFKTTEPQKSRQDYKKKKPVALKYEVIGTCMFSCRTSSRRKRRIAHTLFLKLLVSCRQ